MLSMQRNVFLVLTVHVKIDLYRTSKTQLLVGKMAFIVLLQTEKEHEVLRCFKFLKKKCSLALRA